MLPSRLYNQRLINNLHALFAVFNLLFYNNYVVLNMTPKYAIQRYANTKNHDSEVYLNHVIFMILLEYLPIGTF